MYDLMIESYVWRVVVDKLNNVMNGKALGESKCNSQAAEYFVLV